ncbi:hypothetical protein CPB83DRAFT_747425, partial [Crepidotus variabilis]
EGISNQFSVCHFTWYNRYSKSGKGLNPHIDPASAQKPGTQRRVHTSQSVPRASNEQKDHLYEYKRLKESFGPVFDWLRELASNPYNYKILSEYVEILPAGEPSPVHPFAGFVLNINVSTRVHCDWQDHDICLILVISN